ncbi:hypothetical protein NDU88_004681 [Pleurodeles waltl]|uniref:Uncharacterized protein n=1 Tax=Pleurodeles waltl TaxID=8319 RepID=A0AAV7WW30_PLEWA|nr:hypothetical protein NDU88_004681 [Pleurodeles waltl]
MRSAGPALVERRHRAGHPIRRPVNAGPSRGCTASSAVAGEAWRLCSPPPLPKRTGVTSGPPETGSRRRRQCKAKEPEEADGQGEGGRSVSRPLSD